MKNSFRVWIAIVALIVATLACGQPAQEWQLRGWTVTPSITSFPATTEPTQTPRVVEITTTPKPTATETQIIDKCVVASDSAYLRPSATTNNYPIMPLPKGTRVIDLGGRNNGWLFVHVGESDGWVYGEYLGECDV